MTTRPTPTHTPAPQAPASTGSTQDPATAPIQRRSLGVLYLLLTVLALWVLREFIPAVVWAGVIAIALWPLRSRMSNLRALRQLRARDTWIAGLLTLAVTLLFVLPLIVTVSQAVVEAHGLLDWYRQFQQHGVPTPEILQHLPVVGPSVSDWWQDNLTGPFDLSPAAKALHSSSVMEATRDIGMRTARATLHFGFTLLTLFFLFRAGPALNERLLHGAMRAFGSGGTQLALRMVASVRGTVTGLVAVGIGEGALLGLAYLFTGVPHAALLGMLTGVAAMIPFCAPILFIAAALWLFVRGGTVAAIALLAFGALVVFSAEHFVRPVLIGGVTRLPFLLVLFGILGGAETFGLLGLFVGPALMTVLMLLWSEWTS